MIFDSLRNLKLKVEPSIKRYLNEKIYYKLSPREEQILFLLTLGYSPKYIANIISDLDRKVSYDTIISIINKSLYRKLDVHNLDELINKSVLNNTIKDIPALFKHNKKDNYAVF